MSIEFIDESNGNDRLPENFEPYVKEWFNDNFEQLTPPQRHSFELIQNGTNSLISAPTGSGKTLSAFLSILNDLFLRGDNGDLDNKVYALYISPLRALGNDIQRNLKQPRRGIKKKAEEMGYEVPEVRSMVRTGDTPTSERQKMLRKAPHILVTTPETLGIIINAPKFKEKLKHIEYVIVDEIHSLSENKRGSHLSLSLERLEEMCENGLTRIGLSATQAPIKEIANFLVGYENGKPRPCKIVDVTTSSIMDLSVISPVKDLIHTEPGTTNNRMYDKMHELIQEHTTTLVFTNTRAATERVVNNLKNRFSEHYKDNIGAHHSSMSRDKRLEVESRLKQGDLKVAVTSTSLELGIDIGYIDLVLQLSSPKGVSRAIQRIGRSGHKLHDDPKGRVMVMDRDDALECTEMMRAAKQNELDRIRIPTNCLDVLAQHIVGMACNRKWSVEEAYETIKKSYTFHGLSKGDYNEILKYLAGKYVSLEDQNVYRKIWLDEDDNGVKIFGRSGKMTRVIYMTNIGTIPDESAYRVHTRGNKNFVGTLDEEFLDRLTKGDIFVHGGNTYEFKYARGMKVYVDPRPESSPTVPSWYSEMLPLSYDLGRKIGQLNKSIYDKLEAGSSEKEIVDWIDENYYIDANTVHSIISYLTEQYRYVGEIPTHDKILIEKNVDEEGKLNIVFHTIYGRKVNDALCRIFAHVLSQELKSNVGIVVADHGFVLITPDLEVDINDMFQKVFESQLRDVLKGAIRKTELMKRRFRHVASRALMILRNYKGNKLSVGKQQMKSHFLLAACEKIDKEFPIIKETYREIIEDYMDIGHAKEIVDNIERSEIGYKVMETDVPSPFAHNLVLQNQSDVMLLEDKKQRLQKLHEQIMQKIKAKEDSDENI